MKKLRICMVVLFLMLVTAACSRSMSSDEAADNGYVVYGQVEILNYEFFEEFQDKVASGEYAEVKFAKYTDEGDPIFHYLKYNNEDNTITYTYDSSQDENGKKEKVSTSCKTINVANGIYDLADCDDIEIGERFNAKEKSD